MKVNADFLTDGRGLISKRDILEKSFEVKGYFCNLISAWDVVCMERPSCNGCVRDGEQAYNEYCRCCSRRYEDRYQIDKEAR